jgi:hypothetical protein
MEKPSAPFWIASDAETENLKILFLMVHCFENKTVVWSFLWNGQTGWLAAIEISDGKNVDRLR